jgi:hypothetical protein
MGQDVCIDLLGFQHMLYTLLLHVAPPLAGSAGAHDEVHARVGLDDIGDLADGEPVRGLLERLLHLPAPEPAEVAALRVRRAVRVLGRERAERVRAPADLRLVSAQDPDGLVLRARDHRLGACAA